MSLRTIHPRTSRINRSEQAVPGNNPHFMESAAKGDADVVFLDLEDAIAVDGKEDARKLVIEQPRRTGWELASLRQGQVELTEDHYRIRQDLKAGGNTTIDVTLKRPRLQQLRLINLSTVQLASYAKTGELDGKLRKAFQELAELKGAIERHDRRLKQLNGNRRRIFEEQKRIRDNLGRVPSNSDLHRRYLEKLSLQEDKLESLATEIVQAKEKRNQAVERLQDRIAALVL